MTTRIVALVLTAAALFVPAAAAQKEPGCISTGKCYYVDLRVVSAGFGYGMGTIGGLGTTPDRTMRGLNLRLDVHILSLALRKLPIATYDALFTDMTWGKMSSDPLMYFSSAESDNAMPLTFGYHFLVGLRRESFGVLGGLGYRHFDHDIGDTFMSGSSTPVTARLELGRKKPIVATAWAGRNGMMGAHVDVPFFRRLNISAQYWQADGTAEPSNQPTGTEVKARARLLMFGFRTAEVR